MKGRFENVGTILHDNLSARKVFCRGHPAHAGNGIKKVILYRKELS